MRNALEAHVAATWFMTGVIWFVQVVHYPLMARVGSGRFTDYERAHTRLTGWIVGPAMLAEAATALFLVWQPAATTPRIQGWIGIALLSAIWLSTAFLQVPKHRALERQFDPAAHTSLVRTNWLRTIAWSARALLVASWI